MKEISSLQSSYAFSGPTSESKNEKRPCIYSTAVSATAMFIQSVRALVDPGRGRRRTPPQQDQFLSFSHTFLPKSVCVRGWCPPNRLVPPQREILDLPLTLHVTSFQ